MRELAIANAELAVKQEALRGTRQKQQQERIADRLRANAAELAQLEAAVAELERLAKLPKRMRSLKLRRTKKGPTLRRPNGGKRQ